jgi:hypothetical protein
MQVCIFIYMYCGIVIDARAHNDSLVPRPHPKTGRYAVHAHALGAHVTAHLIVKRAAIS